MIKNIIFDIGNTLLAFDEEAYLAKKFTDPSIRVILATMIFHGKEWDELDRGTLSWEEAIAIFDEKQPNLKQEIRSTLNDWLASLTPMSASIKLLENLKKKGYKIYFLSNFYKTGYYYMRNKFSVLRVGEGTLVSYQVKLMKPEKEIYEVFLAKFNLIAEECLFIDDLEENLEGARKLGIQGLNVKDINKIEDYLR
jgi:putative hydrolase of the HAD superfamily